MRAKVLDLINNFIKSRTKYKDLDDFLKNMLIKFKSSKKKSTTSIDVNEFYNNILSANAIRDMLIALALISSGLAGFATAILRDETEKVIKNDKK